MEVHFDFFGPMRDAVGRKRVTRTFDGTTTVDAALESLCAAFDGLTDHLRDDDGGWTRQVTVTVDGTNVRQLDGYGTTLSDGDVVRLAPPVVGG
ncbi:ubiquitin-like small modifier protein 1 [Haloplanus aerogenes]|jgi:molybdopterin synthase sulfur carrier subunit|uniref:MoaD/ThiS family protein n=1 Tax=Haloplanus aerogenes TaxID=660522 RepID=A0A3M0D991_9EURY|nr:ubiquitin-like small modifier protein 1 [Haloplanus aerogenes]AZH26251.1 MoaD/ThiS family protein [Haloplanus aerogenes]RMB18291.1 molybdopterin synthase sulfur carrier subunit [Haloplanus aerogenes]